jgi:four helix bundle protein
VYKLEIAIEEADESLYWMELIVDAGIVPQERLSPLMQECDEIISILTASAKTMRKSVSK